MNTITFVVLFLAFVALSQQQDADQEAKKKKMHEDIQACIQESGVNPDLPKKAIKDGEFADDKNLKCFFKCIYQKKGRMDANGNLDFSKALNHIPPNADKAKVTAAVDACKNSKGADACETAFLAEKCFSAAIHGH